MDNDKLIRPSILILEQSMQDQPERLETKKRPHIHHLPRIFCPTFDNSQLLQ